MHLPDDLTLRDYFAIHAPGPSREEAIVAAGYLASASPPPQEVRRGAVQVRYQFADDMLWARQGREEPTG